MQKRQKIAVVSSSSTTMERLRKVIEATKILSRVPEGAKCIGTHNGTFHCDEALACGLLKTLSEFQEYGKRGVREGIETSDVRDHRHRPYS